MPERVLIIGIDGGTLDIVNELVREGKLPNMANMINLGTHGKLRSVYPPITSPAWSSFLTGKNPGKHGVFDFNRKRSIHSTSQSIDQSINELVNSTNIKTETLWQIVTRAGKRCCFINVPMTWPVEPVNGIMIPGIPCPSNRISPYPAELRSYLESSKYRSETKTTYYQVSYTDFVEDVLETTRIQAKVALDLFRGEEWDVFMAVFMGADWLSHYFWRYWDKEHPHFNKMEAQRFNVIPRFYELMDETIGEFRKTAGATTTIFVVSDHGFGALHKHVYINSWLRDIGLLRLKEQSSLRRAIPLVLDKVRVTPESLINFLMKYIPPVMKSHAPQALIDDFNTFLSNSPLTPFFNLGDVDWGKTRIFSAGHVGQLWVNNEANDDDRLKSPTSEGYNRTRDYAIEKLRRLVDPSTGRAVVTEVFKREEVYSGPYTSEGPDVVFIMEDLRYVAWEGIKPNQSYFADPDNLASGFHRMDGMFLAIGSAVRKGKLVSASLVDMLPTILHVLSIPIPEDCDGTPLIDTFESDSAIAQRVPKYRSPMQTVREPQAWTPEDERSVEERLRSLGYMG